MIIEWLLKGTTFRVFDSFIDRTDLHEMHVFSPILEGPYGPCLELDHRVVLNVKPQPEIVEFINKKRS